jgi:hypothetical protein
MTRFPVIGKLFAAVIAMGDYESIAAFKQSEHYNHIKDWNFSINFDKKSLYISPNDEQKKKAVKTLAIIGTAITLLLLYRKWCCRKNKALPLK